MKKKSITLSIIIVNYNSLDYLTSCLKSIFASHFPKNRLEVIILDNASGDRKAIGSIRKDFPLKLILNKKNTGFAAACNTGVRISRGTYILLLNPDTVITPDTLRFLVQYMAKNKDVAVTTPYVHLSDGTIDDACHRGFPTVWNSFCHFSGLSGLFPSSMYFNGYHLAYKDMEKVHEIDACVGACMLIRRTAGEEVGWLDEQFFWYGEDLDFCFRIKNSGWKIMYIPDVSVLHYKGVSSGIKSHSVGLSKADISVKVASTKVRFEVMKIFFRKHYLGKYPWPVRILFPLTIDGIAALTLMKYKFSGKVNT